MTWRERRISDMADLINGHPFESAAFADEGPVPLVRIRDILAEPFQTFLPEEIVPDSAYVQDGDVVIGMDGDFNTVYWLRGRAALNQRLCLLRSNGQADTRFLEYALPSHLKVINDLTYATTVKHLSSGQVRDIRLVAPPLDEQRAIADYLDRETARIDTLIAAQQRLIETLRERRAGVIDRGVFGIDNATQGETQLYLIGKHRAVEPLLARCPAGWGVRRFKTALDRLDSRNEDLSVPMMSLKSSGHIVPRDNGRQEPDEKNLPRYLIARPGDLVVNPMWLIGGAIGVTEVEGAVSPDYRVFRSNGSHHPRYLHHLLRSRPYVDQYLLYTRALTTFDRRVQQPDLDNLPLPVPPLGLQRSIASRIDEQTAKIDALISETETFIELSRERRSALITAAVTGQIDVRGAA